MNKKIIMILTLLSTLIISACGRSDDTVPFLLASKINITNPHLEINISDLGESDCILIETKNYNIMIDLGFSEYGPQTLNFLRRRGVDNLDYLIIAHSNYTAKTLSALEALEIGTVILPYTTTHLQEDDFQTIKLNEDYELSFDGITLNLHPLLTNGSQEEPTKSLISILSYADHHFLFAGNIDEQSLSNYLSTTTQSFDIMKLPPFYNNLEDLMQFLDFSDPSHGIITSDSREVNVEFLQALSRRNIQTFLIRNGRITIQANGDNLTFTQELNKFTIN